MDKTGNKKIILLPLPTTLLCIHVLLHTTCTIIVYVILTFMDLIIGIHLLKGALSAKS
jgi:hypothetical protein